jgi:hypothetical protein
VGPVGIGAGRPFGPLGGAGPAPFGARPFGPGAAAPVAPIAPVGAGAYGEPGPLGPSNYEVQYYKLFLRFSYLRQIS